MSNGIAAKLERNITNLKHRFVGAVGHGEWPTACSEALENVERKPEA
jgi:hypothetical protein